MLMLVYSAEDRRYHLSFPFDKRLFRIAISLGSGSYDAKLRCWTFPPQVEILTKILTAFHEEKLYVNPREIPSKVGIFRDLFDATRTRNYSLQTTKTYYSNILQLCSHFRKLPHQISNEDIHNFLKVSQIERNVKASSIRSMRQSYIFYFKVVRNQLLDLKFPRMKKALSLPEVLSENEVLKICYSSNNPKHRLLLRLAYSSGLRVSEVVRLKFSHIDFERKMIRIQQGKGKKDRYSVLADSIVEEIRFHLNEQHKLLIFNHQNPTAHSTSQDLWIFLGTNNDHLSIRTAEKIFENAKLKSGILKNVSFHSLRHAFATHLLEQGTDIRMIQTLLGHSSLRTTQIYTKVAKSRLEKIRSPLDRIFPQG
jgi:integrase/recombinase XerD